jgi:hypothetical protein
MKRGESPPPYPGDLPRMVAEFDLHYCYRWVATQGRHREEPKFLVPFRKMMAEDVTKFFSNYAIQQARYDKICLEREAELEKVVGDLAPCEELVKQMMDEWRAAHPKKEGR